MNKANNQPLTDQEQTELANLAAMPDDQIDYSDIPATSPEQWREAEQGRFYRPVKQQLTLRIDAGGIAWYKSMNGGAVVGWGRNGLPALCINFSIHEKYLIYLTANF